LNFYLVSYDLKEYERDYVDFFNLLNTLGKALQVHRNAIILATEQETQAVYENIREHAEFTDYWVITKLDKDFTGKSQNVDQINRFLRNHRFKD